jgi:hypothetical protein
MGFPDWPLGGLFLCPCVSWDRDGRAVEDDCSSGNRSVRKTTREGVLLWCVCVCVGEQKALPERENAVAVCGAKQAKWHVIAGACSVCLQRNRKTCELVKYLAARTWSGYTEDVCGQEILRCLQRWIFRATSYYMC